MQFIEKLKAIYNIKELRSKILLTLGFLIVYRVGAYIPLPGIDTSQLSELGKQASNNNLLSLLDAFTGGAFSKASIMALGIMPYISASIVVQLMGIAVPYVQRLQKDGDSGRKKLTQITRWLTIAICLVQGQAYITNIYGMLPPQAFLLPKAMFWFVSTVVLISGTIFAMWLGEKITEDGIGNGISLLITVGIIVRLPLAIVQEYIAKTDNLGGGPLVLLLEAFAWIVVIALCVLLTYAVRKIPLQYAKKMSGARFDIKQIEGARQYLPLKLNASGVMPIIFAQALMFLPSFIFNLSESDFAKNMAMTFSDMWSWQYNLLFALLIILFTYFYTAITIPTSKMSDDLKRGGSFIPSVKPGDETSNYLDEIMSRITLPGSIFLAMIAILPVIAVFFGVKQSFALFFGGTSLLIMVGVVIDTAQQINVYLLNSNYDSLMRGEGNKKIRK